MNQYLDFLNATTGAGSDGHVSLEHIVTHQFTDVQQTVSNEGISEFLGTIKNYFFSGKPSVSNMSGGWFDRMSVIQKTLGKTYLDPNWIARRKFVEGNIPAAKFINVISDNGGWNPSLTARTDELIKTMAQVREVLKVKTLAWYDQIKPLIMHLDPNNLTFADAFKLERALAKLEYPQWDYRFKIAMGSTVITEHEITSQAARIANVPALTKEQVIEACQCILAIGAEFDQYNALLETIWRHPVYIKLSELIEATDEVADRQVTTNNGNTTTTQTIQGSSDLDAELHRQFNIMQVFDTVTVYPEFRYMVNVIKHTAIAVDLSVR